MNVLQMAIHLKRDAIAAMLMDKPDAPPAPRPVFMHVDKR